MWFCICKLDAGAGQVQVQVCTDTRTGTLVPTNTRDHNFIFTTTKSWRGARRFLID